MAKNKVKILRLIIKDIQLYGLFCFIFWFWTKLKPLSCISNHILTSNTYISLTLCARMLSHFSHVQLFATWWTIVLQAPLSMGFYRQEYWSELPCPPARELPHLEIEPVSPALIGGFFTISATWEASSRHDQLFLNLQPLPLSGGWWVGLKNPKLLIRAWSFWWPPSIQESSRTPFRIMSIEQRILWILLSHKIFTRFVQPCVKNEFKDNIRTRDSPSILFT